MNELKPEDVIRALELKVQRHLMPNVDIDGTVRVEDAERWLLKLLKEELAPYVSALLREKDALIEDYRQELGRARVALNDANVEIERLRKAKYIYSTVDYCADDLAKAQEKIERLKADNKDLVDLCHLLNHSLEEERSIVIDEFAQRLKKFYDKLGGKIVGGSVEYHIDQIAKEMKEEQDGR